MLGLPPDKGARRIKAITLHVNGALQQGDLADQVWSLAEIIDLSTLYRLEPGDVIFTGTRPGRAGGHGDAMVGAVGVGTLNVRLLATLFARMRLR